MPFSMCSPDGLRTCAGYASAVAAAARRRQLQLEREHVGHLLAHRQPGQSVGSAHWSSAQRRPPAAWKECSASAYASRRDCRSVGHACEARARAGPRHPARRTATTSPRPSAPTGSPPWSARRPAPTSSCCPSCGRTAASPTTAGRTARSRWTGRSSPRSRQATADARCDGAHGLVRRARRDGSPLQHLGAARSGRRGADDVPEGAPVRFRRGRAQADDARRRPGRARPARPGHLLRPALPGDVPGPARRRLRGRADAGGLAGQAGRALAAAGPGPRGRGPVVRRRLQHRRHPRRGPDGRPLDGRRPVGRGARRGRRRRGGARRRPGRRAGRPHPGVVPGPRRPSL